MTQYLKIHHPDIKKVFVVGTKALVKELEIGNIATVQLDHDSSKRIDVSNFQRYEG